MKMTVEHEGQDISVRSLPGDVTYQDVNTAGTALWAFDANQPGDDVVTSTDVNRETEFLVDSGDPVAESRAGYRLIKDASVDIVLAVAQAWP